MLQEAGFNSRLRESGDWRATDHDLMEEVLKWGVRDLQNPR
jgi:hypothetical protein